MRYNSTKIDARHRSASLVYKLLELESKCAEYLGYLLATRSPHVTNVTICLGGPGPGLGPAKIISSINIADNGDNDRDDRNWPEPEEERRTARVIRHFLALGR